MRFFPLATFLLAATPALAQLQPEEAPIQSGLEQLRTKRTVSLNLSGTETYNETVVPFEFDVVWNWDPASPTTPANVRMFYFYNTVPIADIVGDGTTLWAWNHRRREYSATRYGAYNGAAPEGHMATLMQSLNSLTTAYPNTAARFLKEIFAGSNAQYRTWLPGATVVAGEGSVNYSVGDPARRSIEFRYVVEDGLTRLTEVQYFDTRQIGSRERTIRWTMTINGADVPMDPSEFTFQPPAGSRPIVGLRPVTGGG